ncbi:hypothetical protein FNV43_RR16901 [Rhamnella rubrinervis]|uniref:Uncharacterized protein n=1 Tax=Rhamnella rubrinervis TaxID=2594499 RepID=A0A8K0GZS7_9ROSA|nr:hypothetical protein FNV43_RR16901 [Rhamnella rubrinervis]
MQFREETCRTCNAGWGLVNQLSEHPKYTPLLAKILEGLVSRSNVEDKFCHDEVIKATNEFVDSIDTYELAKYLVIKSDPEDEEAEFGLGLKTQKLEEVDEEGCVVHKFAPLTVKRWKDISPIEKDKLLDEIQCFIGNYLYGFVRGGNGQETKERCEAEGLDMTIDEIFNSVVPPKSGYVQDVQAYFQQERLNVDTPSWIHGETFNEDCTNVQVRKLMNNIKTLSGSDLQKYMAMMELQEHMELEKRYRELTDLLQTQLETMASEKAAAEFQLEKELNRLQELQRAAKLLDSGAVRATRFLWQYPTARVILLFYLVFVHLFFMYLLHCLQYSSVDNSLYIYRNKRTFFLLEKLQSLWDWPPQPYSGPGSFSHSEATVTHVIVQKQGGISMVQLTNGITKHKMLAESLWPLHYNFLLKLENAGETAVRLK